MNKLVGIVMSGFLGFFSSEKSIAFGAERSVDLGVATLNFSLQEDFSRDMPAEPLIERADIRQKDFAKKLDSGLLLQRWWDIKTPGFLGKNVGMLMMSIGVHAVPENKQKLVHNKPYDIFDRLDLMLSLNERFHQMYDGHNQQALASGDGEFAYYGASLLIGLQGDYTTPFRDDIVNQTKWTSYSIAAAKGGELIMAHALPLNKETILEVRFTSSPDKSKISVRDFDELVEEIRIDPMFKQFEIRFNEEANELKSLAQGSWLSKTNNDVMQSHLELLQKKFPPSKVEYIAPPDD